MTSCKYEGHSKSFKPQYIAQKIFCIVYISVKDTSWSSTTVGSTPIGVWHHCYYHCPSLPI